MLPAPGTTVDSTQLDGPPPTPALSTGMSPGPSPSPGAPSLGALVPPQPVPTNQVPPQVLTGFLQGGEQYSIFLDSVAQALPDLAPDVSTVKAMFLQLMSKILMAGGGPTAPTAPGPNFPGGGMDRGGMPLASGGA